MTRPRQPYCFRIIPAACHQFVSTMHLIQDLDTSFVQKLKKKIQDYLHGPWVAAVEVLCVGVDESSEQCKDLYRYEVLGGQHTARAKGRVI